MIERRGTGRVARVYVNETCNQACAFCDRRAPRERSELVDPAAVRERIDAAAERAAVVVLTGGEPTLRRDLAELVRDSAGRGARVELETNAALVDAALAGALADAGLTLARVHLPAWGDAADVVTRDPGGFAAAREGIGQLLRAGIPLEIAAPVVAANVDTLPALPRALVDAGWPVRALVLGVPARAPDPSALLSYADAARVVAQVEQEARRHGLALRVDPHAPIPPCAMPDPARVAHLFALTPGGRRRSGLSQRAGCDACAVSDRCPGVPDGVSFEPAPIRQDRVRRRLSVISTIEDQVERELFQDETARPPGRPAHRVRTVRVGFRCNQACSFCFVSTHLPAAPSARIEAVIREAASRGDEICLSGGEPTLDPHLEEWVRLAKRLGSPFVELQTNATRIDDVLARSLRAAGVDLAHVSLHAASAEISDRVTGAPGTFEKTLRGIDALRDAGHRLRMNFVFCQANLAEFPATVALVSTRWPGAELCVSFVAASTDVVPRTGELVPRYADVVPVLGRGLRIAEESGLRLSGFDSMCGVPLCLVPTELTAFFQIADVPAAHRDEEAFHPSTCDGCGLRAKCFGVRRGYAALYGTDELRPVRA